jgi:hypothetical protein
MTRAKWAGGVTIRRAPALPAQSYEFKIQSHPKKKKETLQTKFKDYTP